MKLNIDYIKKLMSDKGISALKLSEHLALEPSVIYHMLDGRTKDPKFIAIAKIMRFFNIDDIEEMIIDEDEV